MNRLEKEQEQEYALAKSYQALEQSLAWQDIKRALDSASERYEAVCANVDPSERASFDIHFAKWQERKLILLEIHGRISDMRARITQLEEEINGDPIDNTELGYKPGSDSRILGY